MEKKKEKKIEPGNARAAKYIRSTLGNCLPSPSSGTFIEKKVGSGSPTEPHKLSAEAYFLNNVKLLARRIGEILEKYDELERGFSFEDQDVELLESDNSCCACDSPQDTDYSSDTTYDDSLSGSDCQGFDDGVDDDPDTSPAAPKLERRKSLSCSDLSAVPQVDEWV